MRNSFRTEMRTNFKLGTQTEQEDSITNKHRDLQGQTSRSQGHVVRLTDVGR